MPGYISVIAIGNKLTSNIYWQVTDNLCGIIVEYARASASS